MHQTKAKSTIKKQKTTTSNQNWKTATGKKKKGKQFKEFSKNKNISNFREKDNSNPFELDGNFNPFADESKKFTKKKHTLLVRNFDEASITKKMLKDHFSQFSEIKKIKTFNKEKKNPNKEEKNSEEESEEEKPKDPSKRVYALLAFKKRKDVMWILKNVNTHSIGDVDLECRLAIEEDEYENIKKRQEDALYTVFLSKVPNNIDENDLSDYFSKFGEIRSTCLINKNKTENENSIKKFGFVLFEEVESVKLTLAQKNHSINNESINCSRYWPKEKNVKSVVINSKGKIVREAEESRKESENLREEEDYEEEEEDNEPEERKVSKGRIFVPVNNEDTDERGGDGLRGEEGERRDGEGGLPEEGENNLNNPNNKEDNLPNIVWVEGLKERMFRFIGILNICEKLRTRHKKMLKLPSGERLSLLRLNKPEEDLQGYPEGYFGGYEEDYYQNEHLYNPDYYRESYPPPEDYYAYNDYDYRTQPQYPPHYQNQNYDYYPHEMRFREDYYHQEPMNYEEPPAYNRYPGGGSQDQYFGYERQYYA